MANLNFPSLEKYKNSFINSCKGFITYNHIVTSDKILKSGNGNNEKILIDYFTNSINNCKLSVCKNLLSSAAPEEFQKLQDKKAAPEEFFDVMNSIDQDKFITEFNLELSKKYWNLNTLFDIVIKKNFEDKAAAAKKEKKIIELKNSDFLSLGNIDNVMLFIWNSASDQDNSEFEKWQLVRDYSKKSSYIVRISNFIPDYYTIKAAPKNSSSKKAAAPEKKPIEIVATIPENEICTDNSILKNAIIDIIKKAAPENRISLIDQVIEELNSYKEEFLKSGEYKAAIEKSSSKKIVDKNKKSGKKAAPKKAAAPEEKTTD